MERLTKLVKEKPENSKLTTSVLSTLSRRVMKCFLSKVFSSPEPELADPNAITISGDDRDIVAHIAGFVLFREKERVFKLQDGPMKIQRSQIIEAISDGTGSSLLTTTLSRGK
jgi:hypothetical protein